MVAVTGAASGVGRLLVQRLAGAEGSAVPREVIAIDEEFADLRGVTWRIADVCDPGLVSRLGGVDVLVHTADDRSLDTRPARRRAHNIRAAQTVLTAAAAAGVPRVFLITSTMVYGAAPDNPVPLPENTPRVSDSGDGLMGDFAEIEALAERARRAHPGLTVTVVRPAPLVGPGLDTLLSRHFSAPRLLTVKGREQHWQFCHVEDLAGALAFCALRGVDGPEGVIAVGGEGSLTQGEVEEIAGMKHFEVPANLAFGTIRRLHQAKITPAAEGELKFLVHPCVVDCSVLREAGWKPAYDNGAALSGLLDSRGGPALVGRSIGRKEVAVTAAGAAGATAAAIGAAVTIRHLRKRKGG
ncbi:NAD-dependent epimerase/dehydratase family protein [Nocardiopsis lambiniae]|uniref:NAD-dependent epimerase/dehydratase family protein n=1 Tax=Nocardiopsis lambiniae TaxID=3075539 RepID=A0ABU2MG35_9ACTN|nr:NAD-dependent epimerase/dehydratase family protein [Nocardiopsis sp. DSM 44743]MDT0331597.1 NAD-dependent epimerase/dehydratase family protein [Nocardiopsis sp. DSM 44743]